MKGWTFGVGLLALASLAADAKDERAAIREAGNRKGLEGLKAALGDVTSIALIRWDKPAVPEPLPPEARARLIRLMRKGVIIKYRTMAHPSWPASLLFRTRSHGTYAVTLVGASNLALDPGTQEGQFTGNAAIWNESRPPELALPGDDRWVWTYFESRLGPTQEKEYLPVPKPKEPIQLP